MSWFGFVTNAGDGTVSTFRVGPGDALARTAVSPVGPGCGTLAVDPERRRVYVAVKGDPPQLLTCRVQADGSLTVLARRDMPDALHYLTLTPDGGRLLAVSYPGGFGLVLPVDGRGVGAPTARVEYPNLHSCVVSADGGTAYLVSLGADLVAQYRLTGGALVPLTPPTVATPRGSGPRHLILNREQTDAYLLTEFTGQVLHLRRAPSGTLTPAGSVSAVDPLKRLGRSRFGADPTAEHLIWGADLHLSGDQRWLWASERSGSTLATVPIGDGGAPADPTAFTATEPQPRGFAVTPDGQHVLVTGERSTTVSLYRPGPDGRLRHVARRETGRGANWVRFLPARP